MDDRRRPSCAHTVGPNFTAGERDGALLASCYSRALEVAGELGAESIAFPLISAGIYGWPLSDAIDIAIGTLAEANTKASEIRLVVRDGEIYKQALEALALG